MLYLYFIQQGDDGPIKIGVAGDPDDRLVQLQRGNPTCLFLRATRPGNFELEREFHDRFRSGWIRGEWFRADTPGLADAIECAKTVPDKPLLSRTREADRRERIEARAVRLARNGNWEEAQRVVQRIPPEVDRMA